MNRETAYKGCKSSGHSDLQHVISCTITSLFSSFLKSVLGTTLPVLAAFTCGCIKTDIAVPDQRSPESGMEIRIRIRDGIRSQQPKLVSADVFSFKTDSLGRLDSYQRITDMEGSEITIGTTGGHKRIFVCCNIRMKEEEIMRIGTVEDLQNSFCMIEDISRMTPPMLGMIETDAGSETEVVMVLTPMTSEIVLRSVRCMFTGTPYEGESIKEAKAYLINVNAQCSLNGASDMARRFVNMGMLNPDDVSAFSEPDIIFQEFDSDIGEDILYPDICLTCFQNSYTEESPGSPFTRLVIEGKIQGTTYYWPLTINRTKGGNGIGNNTRHVFDLIIRRKGSLDPDEELMLGEVESIMEVKQWKEMEEYQVRF